MFGERQILSYVTRSGQYSVPQNEKKILQESSPTSHFGCLMAMACTSKWASKSNLADPMNALAGNPPLK
jgi:hypothetical protein